MKKEKNLHQLLSLLAGSAGFAQVTTNGGSGLATNYPSLKLAISALNDAAITELQCRNKNGL